MRLCELDTGGGMCSHVKWMLGVGLCVDVMWTVVVGKGLADSTFKKVRSTVGKPLVLSSMSCGDIRHNSCRGNTVAMPTQMAAIREELVSSRSLSRRTHSTYWYLLLKLAGKKRGRF